MKVCYHYFGVGNRMSSLKQKIDSYLSKHPGSMAKDMASSFGVSRKEVNSVIYSDRDEYVQDSEYRWFLADTPAYIDDVLKKLNNISGAKEFTEGDFEALADWRRGVAHSGNTSIGNYIFPNGDIVSCDSKYEKHLLKYLDDNDLVLRCGGQALCIQYDSEFVRGKSYYPDIVVLTKKHHIAIIEIKPSISMSYHLNMEKYRALADYCEQRGFEYMMIDPADGYRTYDEIAEMGVCPELLDYFKKPVSGTKRYRTFNNNDVERWYVKYGDGCTKKEFRLQVHSLIIYFNWYNLFDKGFNAFSCPVKLDNDYNVVEVLSRE